MPTAMRALEKSTGKTAKELFKMMELGQLGADYILPFTRALRSLSSEGGALEKALKTLRVQEDRFINLSKLSGDVIYKSGFSEGLSELYKTMSEILQDAGPQLEKLGSIFGKVFKGIAYVFKLVEPPLKFMINNFEILFGGVMLGKMASFARESGAITTVLQSLTGATMMGGLKTLAAALARTFLPITLALGAAEELISLFSDKLVGVTEKKLGHQIDFSTGTRSKLVRKDGKLYSDPNTKESIMGKTSTPLLATISDKEWENTSLVDKILTGIGQEGALKQLGLQMMMQKMFWDTTPPPAAPTTQTNNIYVTGVTGDEVAVKIQRHLNEFAGTGGGR